MPVIIQGYAVRLGEELFTKSAIGHRTIGNVSEVMERPSAIKCLKGTRSTWYSASVCMRDKKLAANLQPEKTETPVSNSSSDDPRTQVAPIKSKKAKRVDTNKPIRGNK